MGIKILKGGEVIAHHTTESNLSHYGQPVWVVENDDPGRGKAIWTDGETELEIKIIGVIGGWLVIQQHDGMYAGIIWSDGNYFADLIVTREGQVPVKQESKVTLKKLENKKYMVRNTVTAFDDESPLGCILNI
jgi:hypothetical protein